MKSNYDQIVKANQTQAGQVENQVPDEVKFQLVASCCLVKSILNSKELSNLVSDNHGQPFPHF